MVRKGGEGDDASDGASGNDEEEATTAARTPARGKRKRAGSGVPQKQRKRAASDRCVVRKGGEGAESDDPGDEPQRTMEEQDEDGAMGPREEGEEGEEGDEEEVSGDGGAGDAVPDNRYASPVCAQCLLVCMRHGYSVTHACSFDVLDILDYDWKRHTYEVLWTGQPLECSTEPATGMENCIPAVLSYHKGDVRDAPPALQALCRASSSPDAAGTDWKDPAPVAAAQAHLLHVLNDVVARLFTLVKHRAQGKDVALVVAEGLRLLHTEAQQSSPGPITSPAYFVSLLNLLDVGDGTSFTATVMSEYVQRIPRDVDGFYIAEPLQFLRLLVDRPPSEDMRRWIAAGREFVMPCLLPANSKGEMEWTLMVHKHDEPAPDIWDVTITFFSDSNVSPYHNKAIQTLNKWAMGEETVDVQGFLLSDTRYRPQWVHAPGTDGVKVALRITAFTLNRAMLDPKEVPDWEAIARAQIVFSLLFESFDGDETPQGQVNAYLLDFLLAGKV